MFTKFSFHLLILCYKYCGLVPTIPFYWNSNSEQLELYLYSNPKHRNKLIRYYITLIYDGIYCIGIWVQIWLSIHATIESLDDKSILALFSVGCTYTTLMQIYMAWRSEQVMKINNESIKFFKEFDRTHRTKAWPTKYCWNDYSVLLTFLSCLSLSNSMAIFSVFQYSNRSFIFSHYLIKSDSSIFSLVLSLLPTFLVLKFCWSTVLFFAMTGLWITMNLLFVLRQIRPRKNMYVKNSASFPKSSYKIYRLLQILFKLFNIVVQDPMLIGINAVLAIIVLSNLVLVFYHRIVPIVGFMVFGGSSAFATLGLILMHIKFGELNEISKGVLRVMTTKAKVCQNINETEKLIWVKSIRSCRDLRVHIRHTGYFTKGSSLKIISRIVWWTNRGILVLRRKL